MGIVQGLLLKEKKNENDPRDLGRYKIVLSVREKREQEGL